MFWSLTGFYISYLKTSFFPQSFFFKNGELDGKMFINFFRKGTENFCMVERAKEIFQQDPKTEQRNAEKNASLTQFA